jgi:hypothetical protein
MKQRCNLYSSRCDETNCKCKSHHDKNPTCNNHPNCFETKKLSNNTFMTIKQQCTDILTHNNHITTE